MGVQVRVRLRAERGREGWVVTHSQQDGHKGALVLQESYADKVPHAACSKFGGS